jgi:hypothetical protein
MTFFEFPDAPVIASAAKQSMAESVDCFVASAPRNDGFIYFLA